MCYANYTANSKISNQYKTLKFSKIILKVKDAYLTLEKYIHTSCHGLILATEGPDPLVTFP